MEFSRIIAIALLGGFLFASATTSGFSCEPNETECLYGCCPYTNAVCCASGYECCEQGQTCIPYIGICIGAQSQRNGTVTLHSHQTAAVKGDGSCPTETTTCNNGCCPFADGVCCEDDQHCCANGYECTASGCMANGHINHQVLARIGKPNPNNPPRSPQPLSSQTCPDGEHQCPIGSNCCTAENGQWTCCPTQEIAGGECCYNWLGYGCCTFLVPKCHYWGCWWT